MCLNRKYKRASPENHFHNIEIGMLLCTQRWLMKFKRIGNTAQKSHI